MMVDILVPRFWILNCRDGGRDIAENSRPLSLDLEFEILGIQPSEFEILGVYLLEFDQICWTPGI